MATHRLVLAMMGLTILVATALAAALADFGGQGLDRAVHRELASAPGTSVDRQRHPDGKPGGAGCLRRAVRHAVGLRPRPLRALRRYLVRRARPAGAPAATETVPQVQAAALGGLRARATLLSGSWPGLPRPGRPVPAALPARVAALLHVAAGDVIATRDARSGKPVLLRVTGLYAPRDQASGVLGP